MKQIAWTALMVSVVLGLGAVAEQEADSPSQTAVSPCVAGRGACIDAIDVRSPVKGQVVTVTGQDLQSDDAAVQGAHAFFADSSTRHGFEKGAAHEDLSNDGYGCGNQCGQEEGWDGDGFYDGDVKLSGRYSAKFYSHSSDGACRTPGGCGGSYNYVFHPGSFAEDYWFRFAFRLQNVEGWPTLYTKLFYGLGSWYVNFDATSGPNRIFGRWNFVDSGRNNSRRLAHRQRAFDEKRWYWLVCHWKATSPREYLCEQDGEIVYSARPGEIAPPNYSLFGTINAHSGVRGPGWGFRTWIDNLLVSGQRLYPSAVIEVCDRKDYGNAKCEWQAPVTISNTSIQFTFDKGNLSCKTCFVTIRNSKQEQSPGIEISS